MYWVNNNIHFLILLSKNRFNDKQIKPKPIPGMISKIVTFLVPENKGVITIPINNNPKLEV